MTKVDSLRAIGASGFMTAAGLAQSGPAGLAFMVEPIPVPLWFLLAAVALPTGELLAAGRGVFYNRTAAKRPNSDGGD